MLDRRQILLKLFKIFDLLVMLGSFALATWGSFCLQNGKIPFDEFLSMRIKIQNFAFFLGFILVWQLIFSGLGLYSSRRLSSRAKEVLDLLKATSLGTLVLLASAVILSLKMLTPTFHLIFWGASSTVCILSRLFLRRFLIWLRLKGRNIRYMLIVGTNERAVRFARNIESQPELGYKILGFVDNGWKDNGEFKLNGYRKVCDFEGLPSYIRQNAVDEVVLCLPIKSFYEQTWTISRQCEEQGIIVRHLSDLFVFKMAHSRPDSLGGDPFMSHYTGAMEGWQIQVKRMLDILLSSVMLLASSPIFLAAALAIKITSPGPIFFLQERVGLSKRRFRLYKLRTMVPDAEKRQAELEDLNECKGAAFKIKNDPRITPIGRILRKTSIDELPQLFNVLKGDMSLVGPRPLPVRDYNGFNVDWQRRRFSVRPGITCLWQINGRHNMAFDKWMELDIAYIDQWSLLLDLKILVKTVPAVLGGDGAT